MRLAVAQARRVDVRFGPGSLQRQQLPIDPGDHQARAAPVAGDSGAADDRVDPIVVALGVGQTLQDHDAHALPDEDAVGAAVEGPDDALAAQGAELAEHTPERDVVAQVHSASQRQVRAP